MNSHILIVHFRFNCKIFYLRFSTWASMHRWIYLWFIFLRWPCPRILMGNEKNIFTHWGFWVDYLGFSVYLEIWGSWRIIILGILVFFTCHLGMFVAGLFKGSHLTWKMMCLRSWNSVTIAWMMKNSGNVCCIVHCFLRIMRLEGCLWSNIGLLRGW